ncbi:MAG: glycosyltransferase [Chloroflexota bacterium]
MGQYRIVRVDDYERFVGREVIERIQRKAQPLRGLRVVNVNSTYYGGGVAQLLSSMTLLMSSLGISVEWRAIHGPPDFFNVTKKMHNGLQGGKIAISEAERRLYEEVVYENAMINPLDQDMIIIHDPQPLPMINHYRKKCPWVWRCHIDLSQPDRELWSYLAPMVEKYDGVILSTREYRQEINTPQMIFMPAIDPFSLTNRELSQEEADRLLHDYHIPTDLPLVVQVSRFDRWKDQEGVMAAFKLARKEVDCTLVLLGNVATDDPEGESVYQSLLGSREERIIILNHEDALLVNALQRRADVVLQKSLREGFGLTVAEAMWKGTPVIGGNVGGIRYQIDNGENGFLVSSVAEAAGRIVALLQDRELREKLGQKARETVRGQFLLTRLLEQYLGLFGSFEPVFRLNDTMRDYR